MEKVTVKLQKLDVEKQEELEIEEWMIEEFFIPFQAS